MTDFLDDQDARRRSSPPARTSSRASSSPDTVDLRITLKVNGEVMQDESIDDIIYGVEALVALRVERGRAAARRPAADRLAGRQRARITATAGCVPGDVMEGAITGLGVQRNRCVSPEVATR